MSPMTFRSVSGRAMRAECERTSHQGRVTPSLYRRRMVATLAALVFPARCPGCGVAAEPVCPSCRAAVHAAPSLPSPAGLTSLHVPFAYEGVVRELVARAKYRNRHAALTWLAAEMLTALGDSGSGCEEVTWAPTSNARRRARGFDQAELLARAVGVGLQLPVRARLRRRAGAPQTGASRVDRAAGPEFVPVGGWGNRGPRAVILVDDVVTTGATMRSAAAVLRRSGVTEVRGLAVARRP